MNSLRFFIVNLLILFSLVANAQVLGVDAPKVVSKNETFRLVYTATGKPSRFIEPIINDFEVLAGPSTSTMSSTSIINGRTTSSVEMSYTYVLQAKSIGEFTIPAASIEIDGKTVESKEVLIEVLESGVAQDNQSNSGISDDDIKLILELDKSKVIEGEPIIATLKLYTKTNINGFSDVIFPTFDGFWSQELEVPQNIEFQREAYQGQIYNSALIRTYMLIPQQTGRLTISPAEIVCQIQIRTTNSGTGSIFDSFFDNYETINKRVSTPGINVVVSSLPTNSPASFTGGVGEFQVEAELARDNLAAHEAGALIIRISGQGNISMIEPMKLNLPADFELYDVKRTDEIQGISGVKKFEYPFIPRTPGKFTIELPSFSFYSTKQKKYVTLSIPPLEVLVSNSTETNAVVLGNTGVNQQFVKDLGTDIRYISTNLKSFHRKDSLLVSKIWYYIIFIFIIILTYLIEKLLTKNIKRRNDVVGSRNRKAKKIAKIRLKKAEGLMRQNLYSAYYEELHRAIIGYISDKLLLSISDVTRDNISEKLSEKEVSPVVIQTVIDTIDACEYARYSPSEGYEAMEKHYNDAVSFISEIES